MSDRIQIKSIGELIAAVPTMLSFVPVQSIVLIFLNEGRLSFVARTDFGTGGRPLKAETVAKTTGADSAILVAVAKDRTFREVIAECERVNAMLRGFGVEVEDTYYTPSIEGGETWTDMRTFETGTVVDPTTTEFAAATVLTGKTVAKNRDEITDRYRRTDAPSADGHDARATRKAMGENFAPSVLSELADIVGKRQEPTAALAARVGLLLTTDTQARDATLGLAVIDTAVASETMAAVARMLQGPERVATLTAAGFFAYVDFQGPSTRCAIDAARAEAAQHPLCNTRLLDLIEQALEAGIHPKQMRKVSGTGVGVARSAFGVELPAPSPDWL